MDIIGKFKNGVIIISNLKTEDDEYKYHFNFDINISAAFVSYTYSFGECVYFRMFDFIDFKENKLPDECEIDNYLEMTKEYFSININQDGVVSSIKINFETDEDKENLENFLLELKANCEYLLES